MKTRTTVQYTSFSFALLFLLPSLVQAKNIGNDRDLAWGLVFASSYSEKCSPNANERAQINQFVSQTNTRLSSNGDLLERTKRLAPQILEPFEQGGNFCSAMKERLKYYSIIR
jgi:hypothetical protein